MFRRPLCPSVVVASALALIASAAVAAPTDWDQPSGSQSAYTYSNGQSSDGLFGSPAVYTNGFIFAPPGLVASTTAGGFNEKSDTVSVILNAKPNTVFTNIGARLKGDYSAIFGLSGVDSNATLRIYNLDAPGSQPITSPLAFDPTFPRWSLDEKPAGEFAGAGASVIPASWRNIRVELTDYVSAASLDSTALIQTKGLNIDVETASVPLPAAVAVAPILGVLAWKARRRFAR